MAVILRLQLPIGHKRLVANVDADAQLRIWNDADVMICAETRLRVLAHDAAEFCQSFSPRKSQGAGDPQETRARATLKSEGAARPSIEGAGNAGCPKHPRPVCESSVHTVVTTVAPEHPAFPHAMVLTAYATLSPATNSSCHRRGRIGGVADPGWARNTSAGLAPATGARTTWFCRTRPVFARRLRRHVHVRPSIDEAGSNIVRPRAGPMLTGVQSNARPATPCATTLPRPPHPIPTFVTIAIRPFRGMRRSDISR